MFEACASHLTARLLALEAGDDFSAKDLALIANAYAKTRAGPYVLPLMRVIGSQATQQLNTVAPSVGHSTQPDPLLQTGDSWSHQDVALLLNAFAKLQISNNEVFEAAGPVIVQNIASYNTQ